MKGFLLGLILGFAAFPVGMYVYMRNGTPPVAVADHPFPMEQDLVRIPLETRVETEVQQLPPIEATPANLAAGALTYSRNCAMCHGVQGHPSRIAASMYPRAPQLWESRPNGAVGVSMAPPGVTYWKIENGIRMTGMPAFGKIMSSEEVWQLTLLLSHANQPLPSGAARLLRARGAMPDLQRTEATLNTGQKRARTSVKD